MTRPWHDLSSALKKDAAADAEFGWMLEMWGYSIGAAVAGITHELLDPNPHPHPHPHPHLSPSPLTLALTLNPHPHRSPSPGRESRREIRLKHGPPAGRQLREMQVRDTRPDEYLFPRTADNLPLTSDHVPLNSDGLPLTSDHVPLTSDHVPLTLPLTSSRGTQAQMSALTAAVTAMHADLSDLRGRLAPQMVSAGPDTRPQMVSAGPPAPPTGPAAHAHGHAQPQHAPVHVYADIQPVGPTAGPAGSAMHVCGHNLDA